MPPMRGMTMPAMPTTLPGDAWSPPYLATSFVMWAVMMVAMMLPSATPMILLHDVFSRKNRLGPAATLAFSATYLALWTGFALVATLIQSALIAAGLVGEATLAIGNAKLAAALLLAVAAFELSPLKRICLAHCQSPLTFLTRHWRPGIGGAITMGWKHGLFCVGCCAGLMLLLLVGGVMNLAWIAVLTLIVLAEKYAPPAWRADRVLAFVLTLAAIAIATHYR